MMLFILDTIRTKHLQHISSRSRLADTVRNKLRLLSSSSLTGRDVGIRSVAASNLDPSARHLLKDPASTPVMLRARYFFDTLPASCCSPATTPRPPFHITLGAKTGWRCVAKLAVRHQCVGQQGHFCGAHASSPPAIGLFLPGTHRVLSQPSVAHHPSIERAVDEVREACAVSGVLGYEEIATRGECLKRNRTKSSKKHQQKRQNGAPLQEGWLKYLLLSADATTGRVQLTLVWDAKAPPPPREADLSTLKLSALDDSPAHRALSSLVQVLQRQRNRSVLESLWVHFNPSTNPSSGDAFGNENSITSLEPHSWRHMWGPRAVYERLVWAENAFAVDSELDGSVGAPPLLVFPPSVFRQANSEAFKNIIASIRHWTGDFAASLLPSSRWPRCLELYGGVGTLGLNCIDMLQELLCSDENPHNKACFEETVANLPVAYQGRATYHTSSAANMLLPPRKLARRRFDLLIVDPPRKGLDSEVLRALVAPQNERGGTIVSTVQRLIYVSCGFKSFQRDASVLLGLSPPRDPLIEVGISDKATGSGGQTDPSQAGQGGSSAW
eukprot:CAMPEP_0114419614 /NCGR_PEP_ID=MMETSP0103-20121206/4124_1 /TAXON_ID=37642 ORGANISM="Paraphysomonas imperforata, Strain PA2" /NCGR_SAMPLE_ID=MMETSP0103 /ASSEMBLY_ACC=CAM_ASM_000201 /LENGTH=555 /DNA_ID=CAMNT_0001588051 /DNA_START=102 /DNA_END=1766 /DNA_ORIENTATION=+